MLTCKVCGLDFTRKGTRGPIPQFCSIRCKGKRDRLRPERKLYERNYRRAARASGRLKDYEFNYNRRPDVLARQRDRWRVKNFYGTTIAAPYSGHRWLDMAAKVVGREFDPTAPWADGYYDEMGEAVLALLEGRDMQEAVKSFRRSEYVPRHLTVRMGDWGDDEDLQNRWFERVMPQVESAEDTYIAGEAIEYTLKDRFNNVSVGSRGRRMHQKISTPSNRRSNNK